MITLDRTKSEAGLQVVEKPEDVLPPLSRLDYDDDAIINQLILLGHGPLQRLANLTESALARVGGNNSRKKRSRRSVVSRTISRPNRFGD